MKSILLVVLLLIQNEYCGPSGALLVDFQLNTMDYKAVPYKTFIHMVEVECSK